MALWLPDLASYKAITLIPAAEIDAVEVIEPGWTRRRAALVQGRICDKLRKRYGDYNSLSWAQLADTVKYWLVAILDRDVYVKRGRNAADPAMTDQNREADAALVKIDEAANSKDGLIELPIVQGADTSGVNHGGPLFYSEASPFIGADRQERAARGDNGVGGEDERGDGTLGGV